MYFYLSQVFKGLLLQLNFYWRSENFINIKVFKRSVHVMKFITNDSETLMKRRRKMKRMKRMVKKTSVSR